MSDFEKNLTAKVSVPAGRTVLGVNEELMELAKKFRDKQRPEDVLRALELVGKYSDLVKENPLHSDKEFQRIKRLLPEAEIEFFQLDAIGQHYENMLDELT